MGGMYHQGLTSAPSTTRAASPAPTLMLMKIHDELIREIAVLVLMCINLPTGVY